MSLTDQIIGVFTVSLAVALGALFNYLLMKWDGKRTLRKLSQHPEVQEAKDLLNNLREIAADVKILLKKMKEAQEIDDEEDNEESDTSTRVLPDPQNYTVT